LWHLARRWSGYPELEWTHGIFGGRITALAGLIPAYFYEDLDDFDLARLLIRVGNVLRSIRQASSPVVSLGFEYFDSAYRVPDGRLRSDGTSFRGHHWVTAEDHLDADEIGFANSWDPGNWGDHGYGYITREYFERHVDMVLAGWPASGGPSPAFERCMNRADTLRRPRDEHIVHCWPTRNVFWTQRVATERAEFTMLNWNVNSVATGAPVDVIELREGDAVVGRAHMFRDDDATFTLRELFVHPDRRRQHIALLMEGTAAEWARAKGARELRVWLRDADARERVAVAALGFASRRGYGWEDMQMRRPNIVKIGRREL
jgi:GNAT superfamily N-acetyltransferase